MSKEEVKSSFWGVTTFLGRAEIVFNRAIDATPTGPFRDQLTVLNMERMALIHNNKDVTAYAKRLRDLLDKIVANEEARNEMSCDTTRFADTTFERGVLLGQLVEVAKL